MILYYFEAEVLVMRDQLVPLGYKWLFSYNRACDQICIQSYLFIMTLRTT